MKKSKQYLADAARKAAEAATIEDPNGNKRELKLDIVDPLTYWVVQVSNNWKDIVYTAGLDPVLNNPF